MCVTAAVGALIITGIGSLVTAAGAIQQGNAIQAQQKFNAQVQENNAVIFEARAEDALRRGKLEERRRRLVTDRVAGAQTAAFAASGVQVSTGSPLDVILSTVEQGELNAQIVRANAEREALGFTIEAQNLRSSASLSLLRGREARKAGLLGAGSSLLGGAADVLGGVSKLPKPATG